ncbi:MAG: porphobilinogen synthase [Candidatus Eisenbacteria bacterium]|uniref:Delta-aminolevulinic acid dehydratase n=1 Tax=Eiseniibacteriota bacterium TaxID=2212470 RepID=A0A948RXS0_UNCEI|nr:porphobilinogen synthase [Candidatus Eisenbacteria bacterium]MBU1950286.1 porphobilinogen synthase [Candidatus Eisenbacteria bacterium]MBU2691502.1 porphobilinogen synthase [Candidatus Eisenbacteria bacterium]
MDLLRRPRRLRKTLILRELVAETSLAPRHLVTPHFVVEGNGVSEEIPSMPGVKHVSVDSLLGEIASDVGLGLKSHLLFGIPGKKDEAGEGAADKDGIIPRALRALRERFGEEIILITDVCLCAYTTHGHCGLMKNGEVVNDESVQQLAKMALVHAEAGADIVSPSDMMDGRVAGIRNLLDDKGYTNVSILAYSAKYASAYYGPFRDACDSSPQGDRKTYQMDYRNSREAVLEALLDIDEGADMIMVKPALAYLDIVAKLRAESLVPVVVYNVSGEFSMVKAAVAAGYADEAALVLENLFAMRRAGADLIITYHGREACQKGWIQ